MFANGIKDESWYYVNQKSQGEEKKNGTRAEEGGKIWTDERTNLQYHLSILYDVVVAANTSFLILSSHTSCMSSF